MSYLVVSTFAHASVVSGPRLALCTPGRNEAAFIHCTQLVWLQSESCSGQRRPSQTLTWPEK